MREMHSEGAREMSLHQVLYAGGCVHVQYACKVERVHVSTL